MDEQLKALHEGLTSLGLNYMDLLPLLPVISKHAGLIQSLSNHAPEFEAAAAEIWPHVQAINATIVKNQPLIDKVKEWTPELQQLVTEALPIIHQISPPPVITP